MFSVKWKRFDINLLPESATLALPELRFPGSGRVTSYYCDVAALLDMAQDVTNRETVPGSSSLIRQIVAILLDSFITTFDVV